MDDSSPGLDEAQIYAAVDGLTPSGGPADELGTYLRSLRNELCTPPGAQDRWNHLAAMRRASAAAKRGKTRGLAVIAAATVGLVSVTTGLAAADRLPRSAQDQVARIAEIVGVDLPGNDAHPAATSEPGPGTEHSESAVGTQPPGSVRSLIPRSGISSTDAGSPPGTTLVAVPQIGSPPSRSGEAPPQTVTPPGAGVAPPGQSGAHLGQGRSATGQDGSRPGRSEAAPGHIGEISGMSALAPGHTGAIGTPEATPADTIRARIVPEHAAGS